MSAIGSPPPVDSALEPRWVRDGSAKTQQTYAAALAFEEVMVRELAGSVGEAGAGEEGEAAEGQGPRFGAGMFSAMLPGALAQGVVAGGGLGLAAQLTRQLEGADTIPAQRATGGTGA